MYTEEDRRISNDILMELKRNHLVEESEMYEFLNLCYGKPRDSFVFEKQCCFLWKELESMGLVKNNNRRMSLTCEGHLAATIGISEYLLKYKKSRDLEVKSKETAYWYNKIEIAKTIFLLIGAVLGWIARSLL